VAISTQARRNPTTAFARTVHDILSLQRLRLTAASCAVVGTLNLNLHPAAVRLPKTYSTALSSLQYTATGFAPASEQWPAVFLS
jgi:hypothetical protein